MGKSTINPAVVGKHSTDIAALKNDLGIVEDGDTATHTIAQGQYVIWQGALYTADAAIASGTTLAASGGNKNLTAVENGGLNALNSNLSTSYYTIPNIGVIRFIGKIAVIDFTNASGQIPSTGLQLPYTFVDDISTICQYYNGSANAIGVLLLYKSGKVYVRMPGAYADATYVLGQVVAYLAT